MNFLLKVERHKQSKLNTLNAVATFYFSELKGSKYNTLVEFLPLHQNILVKLTQLQALQMFCFSNVHYNQTKQVGQNFNAVTTSCIHNNY